MTKTATPSSTTQPETARTRKPDLASLYRPLGINAVIAAAMLVKPDYVTG